MKIVGAFLGALMVAQVAAFGEVEAPAAPAAVAPPAMSPEMLAGMHAAFSGYQAMVCSMPSALKCKAETNFVPSAAFEATEYAITDCDMFALCGLDASSPQAMVPAMVSGQFSKYRQTICDSDFHQTCKTGTGGPCMECASLTSEEVESCDGALCIRCEKDGCIKCAPTGICVGVCPQRNSFTCPGDPGVPLE